MNMRHWVVQTYNRRLIRAMKWVAILSESEAAACIRDHRDGLAYSGEAVNHFGGTRAVILAAWKARGNVRRYYAWERFEARRKARGIVTVIA